MTAFGAFLDPVADKLMVVIALVLLLASINFTTLSIGRSFVRAKEVGVRKVVGSSRASSEHPVRPAKSRANRRHAFSVIFIAMDFAVGCAGT